MTALDLSSPVAVAGDPLGPFEGSRGPGGTRACSPMGTLHECAPSGRRAPLRAFHRHAYATDKREGTS
ncbi:hypothetical protein ACWEQ7_06015 [Streptomyces sp. NPDC004069]